MPLPADARTRGERGADLFGQLSGAWTGTGIGAADLGGGRVDRVACDVTYQPSDAAHLHVLLGCTSAQYRVAIEADLARDGQRIAGTLVERTLGIPGTLSGTTGADRLDAVVSGMGVSGSLSLTMRGGVQTVVSRGLGSVATAGAAVQLRKL